MILQKVCATYCKLGEQPFPLLKDELGTLSSGQLIGGQASDFRESSAP